MNFIGNTVFITATDTGVGKSIFTAFLALSYLHNGKKVAISKPIQTGLEKDTDFLSMLTGNKIPVFNTYSFLLGAAPQVAASHENKMIAMEKVILDIRKLEKEFDCIIVEGIGGIAVPLATGRRESFVFHEVVGNDKHLVSNENYLVAHLIKELNYPAIIVARPTLGTINHTVLTIEFAKQKDLNIVGFVVSGYDKKTNGPVVKTAPEMISDITGIKCLMKIPYIKRTDYESLDSIARNTVETFHAMPLKQITTH